MQTSPRMKPRVGVYLSKRTAARLTTTARRRGASKSALVEAALDRFLDADDVHGAPALFDRLGELSGQIDQLDRNLGIMSEIVGLHAQFHLAMAPDLPAGRPHRAAGAAQANFDRGTARRSLSVERAADMTGAVERNAIAVGRGGRNSPGPALSAAHEPSLKSSQVDARKDTA